MTALPIDTHAGLSALRDRVRLTPVSDELRELIRDKGWTPTPLPVETGPSENDLLLPSTTTTALAIELARLLGGSRRHREVDRVLISAARDLGDGAIGQGEFDLLTEATARQRAQICADANAHHARYGAPRRPFYNRNKAKDRRRGLLRLGVVPDRIGNGLTPGEEAVVAVVLQDIRHHGHCDKTNGEIAQLAGCSVRLVCLAKAKLAVLPEFQITRRPRMRQRHETTIIRIASTFAGDQIIPQHFLVRVGERRFCVHQTPYFNKKDLHRSASVDVASVRQGKTNSWFRAPKEKPW